MKAKTIFALLFSGALAVSAGCTGGDTKPDEKQTEEKVQKGDEADQKVDERGIPELAPLQMADKDVEIKKLGEVNGTTAYKVGDVTVLHKETPANSVVAARVYISGGATHLTEKTAGIERLALNTAVSGGTESHPKDEFNALLDSMGSSVAAFSDRDFSGYTMKSVVDNFDKTWELMLESMLEPKLPQEELELQRQRHLADIRSLNENPDRLVGHVATKLLFEGHPYHTLQLGTEENVEAFTQKQIAAYQRAMLRPEKMTVVVVGNVSDEKILSQVQKIAKIQPQASLPDQQLTPYNVEKAKLKVEEKDIPTNYIFGLFPAPSPGDEDYEAMLVAVEYLRDRLFEEVRTKRNLTYAVSSGLSDRRVNYGYLYVTAVDPAKTMPVIFSEVQKLKDGELTDEQLEQSSSSPSTIWDWRPTAARRRSWLAPSSSRATGRSTPTPSSVFRRSRPRTCSVWPRST
jgi:predicted Zn-dependent peptidase